MSKFRYRPAERRVNLALPPGVGQVIVATNDVGDTHIVVVDDDRQIVGRRPVAPDDDEVVELIVREPDIAHDMVANHRFAFVR